MYGITEPSWKQNAAQPDNGMGPTPQMGGGGPAGASAQGRPVDIYGMASSVAGLGRNANTAPAAAPMPQAGGGGVSPGGAMAQIQQDDSIQKDASQQQATASNASSIMKIVQAIYGGGAGMSTGSGGAYGA